MLHLMEKDKYSILLSVLVYSVNLGVGMFLIWMTWFIIYVIYWYFYIINKNPRIAKSTTVSTKNTYSNEQQKKEVNKKLIAPHCNFRQYLRYLWLVTLPYVWSLPIKYCKLIYICNYKKFDISEHEKRVRLAKFVLETSLALGFDQKYENNMYAFTYKNFYLLSKKDIHQHITRAVVLIYAPCETQTILQEITIDENPLVDINEMFAFLHSVGSVLTHAHVHAQAGNVAEFSLQYHHFHNDVDSKELYDSIDDMHAAAACLNESANHYPADLYGVRRIDFQTLLGYNTSITEFKNHQRTVQLKDISKYVRFNIKSRIILKKYLGRYNLDISTIMANIFHSLDHYNTSKYFLYGSEIKSYNGVDVRKLHGLIVELNYDLGSFQSMRYAKQNIWKSIYNELKEIDEEYASNLHMFLSA